MQPYSDENMIFDEVTRHFVLTEHALQTHGTDIRRRVSRNKTIDATGVINRLCTRVSEIIYTYLHTFTMNNAEQDEIIATVEACRPVIFSALLNQAEYLLMNGDFSRSAEPDKRKFAIDETAKSVLDTVIPCLGVSITYAGAGGYGLS